MQGVFFRLLFYGEIAIGKNPAFQFYPGDWTRDLDDYPLEIEGAWIRICCRLWWSETPGSLSKSLKEWSRILRNSEKKTEKILHFLIEKHIANGHNLDNQNITIISRRMVHDYKISQLRREVGRLGGNPGLKKIKENRENLVNQTINQNSTKKTSLPLQSSSSSSKQKKIYKRKILSDEEWKEEMKNLHPWINWYELDRDIATWLLNNPNRKKTRRLITTFIINKQKDKPMDFKKPKDEYEIVGGKNG